MRLLETAPERQELLSEALWLPSCLAYYRGDFPKSLEHLQNAFALHEPERTRLHALRTGQNSGVVLQCYIALCHWELGFADQARQRLEETVRLARELRHPFSLAFALYHHRRLHQYCRLDDSVRRTIEEEYQLCHEQSFSFFEAHAILARAALLVRQGKAAEARRQLEHGIQMFQATGCNLTLTHPYSFLAEAFVQAGQLTEATEMLDRAFVLVEQRDERCLESELLRLRGEVLLAASPRDETGARLHFERALEVAVRQQSRSRKLHALLSLCRLPSSQHTTSDPRQRLAELVASFTEGLDLPDLVEAKALLNNWTAAPP
jgi:tetratricopeptide (TPR) repeat protein